MAVLVLTLIESSIIVLLSHVSFVFSILLINVVLLQCDEVIVLSQGFLLCPPTPSLPPPPVTSTLIVLLCDAIRAAYHSICRIHAASCFFSF